MYFRFGSALFLVVIVSLVGVAIENQCLELRRGLSRQHYEMEVLRELYARKRLKTQELGATERVLDALEQGQLVLVPSDSQAESGSEENRIPLLRWQRPLSPPPR